MPVGIRHRRKTAADLDPFIFQHDLLRATVGKYINGQGHGQVGAFNSVLVVARLHNADLQFFGSA